jgi:hypothetical protein
MDSTLIVNFIDACNALIDDFNARLSDPQNAFPRWLIDRISTRVSAIRVVVRGNTGLLLSTKTDSTRLNEIQITLQGLFSSLLAHDLSGDNFDNGPLKALIDRFVTCTEAVLCGIGKLRIATKRVEDINSITKNLARHSSLIYANARRVNKMIMLIRSIRRFHAIDLNKLDFYFDAPEHVHTNEARQNRRYPFFRCTTPVDFLALLGRVDFFSGKKSFTLRCLIGVTGGDGCDILPFFKLAIPDTLALAECRKACARLIAGDTTAYRPTTPYGSLVRDLFCWMMVKNGFV